MENNRNNLPMSSVNLKSVEFMAQRMAKNQDSMFAVFKARINGKAQAYIGKSQNGKDYINIPVVADYFDGAAKYAGLTAREDGAGLFFTVSLNNRLAERTIALVQQGKLRSGATVIVSGLTSMRPSEDGRYENGVVYAATFDIDFWGKRENPSLTIRGAAPAPASAPKPTAAPKNAPTSVASGYSNEDFAAIDDDEDLPF